MRRGFALSGVVLACILIPIVVLSGLKVVSMYTRGMEIAERAEGKRKMAQVKAQLVSMAVDADGDGHFELLAPQSGRIPASVPGGDVDGYGVELLYCAWDLGFENLVDAAYVSGTTAPPLSGLAGRLVSAGADRVMQSDCSAVSGDDAYVDIAEADVSMGTGGLGGFADDGGVVTLITPSDKVSIGGENPTAKLQVTVDGADDGLLVEGVAPAGDVSSPFLSAVRYGAGVPSASVWKTSGSKSFPEATPAGAIGRFGFYGHDGSVFFPAATMVAVLEQAATATDRRTKLTTCVAAAGSAGDDPDACMTLGGKGLSVGMDAPSVSVDAAGDVAARGGRVFFARDDAAGVHSFIDYSGGRFTFRSGESETPGGPPTGDIRAKDGYLSGGLGVGSPNPGGYALYVGGDAYATGLWQGSDARLKKDVVPLGLVSGKVATMKPVTFRYRDDIPGRRFPDRPQIGVMAQDVEKSFPELVTTDKDGYKAVAYDKLSVILLKAVSEQAARIDALEKRIFDLEAASQAER